MNIQEWLEAGKPWNVILHGDCMDLMKHFKDKEINLSIVDPPYGIGGDAFHTDRPLKGAGKLKNIALNKFQTKWDIAPDENYFLELKRISINQIIWGGNYFNLGRTRGFIIWDKLQYFKNFFACEFAWTSFEKPSAMYQIDCKYSGKIHPTQKPVALYRWLLRNYAKPGDKIIDTHSGSGSLACACHLEKFDFLAIEKDEDYFNSSVKRLEELRSQGVLF